jgi:hypothetical protein
MNIIFQEEEHRMLKISGILDSALEKITNIIETEFANKYRGEQLSKQLLDRIALDIHMFLCDEFNLDPHGFTLKIQVVANDFGLVRVNGISAYLKASLRG